MRKIIVNHYNKLNIVVFFQNEPESIKATYRNGLLDSGFEHKGEYYTKYCVPIGSPAYSLKLIAKWGN